MYTPLVDGRMPVMSAAREELHAGAAQWALVNRTPRFARRSRFGILVSGWPPRPRLAASISYAAPLPKRFAGAWCNTQACAEGRRTRCICADRRVARSRESVAVFCDSGPRPPRRGCRRPRLRGHGGFSAH